MSYFHKIRRAGGLAEDVKMLADEMQRYEAEHGLESAEDFRQARVDYDQVAYSSAGHQAPSYSDLTKNDNLAHAKALSLAEARALADGVYVSNHYGWVPHDNHKLWLAPIDGNNAINLTGQFRNGLLNGTIRPAVLEGGPLHYCDHVIELLSAQSQRIEFPDILDPGLLDFTIACWVYPLSSGTAMHLGAKRNNDGATTSPGFRVGLASTNLRPFYTICDGLSTRAEATAGAAGNITALKWTHVAWVFTRNLNVTWYVNGQSVGTSTALTAHQGNIDNSLGYWIGRAPAGTATNCNVRLADYHHLPGLAASQAQVQQLMKYGQLLRADAMYVEVPA